MRSWCFLVSGGRLSLMPPWRSCLHSVGPPPPVAPLTGPCSFSTHPRFAEQLPPPQSSHPARTSRSMLRCALARLEGGGFEGIHRSVEGDAASTPTHPAPPTADSRPARQAFPDVARLDVAVAQKDGRGLGGRGWPGCSSRGSSVTLDHIGQPKKKQDVRRTLHVARRRPFMWATGAPSAWHRRNTWWCSGSRIEVRFGRLQHGQSATFLQGTPPPVRRSGRTRSMRQPPEARGAANILFAWASLRFREGRGGGPVRRCAGTFVTAIGSAAGVATCGDQVVHPEAFCRGFQSSMGLQKCQRRRVSFKSTCTKNHFISLFCFVRGICNAFRASSQGPWD